MAKIVIENITAELAGITYFDGKIRVVPDSLENQSEWGNLNCIAPIINRPIVNLSEFGNANVVAPLFLRTVALENIPTFGNLRLSKGELFLRGFENNTQFGNSRTWVVLRILPVGFANQVNINPIREYHDFRPSGIEYVTYRLLIDGMDFSEYLLTISIRLTETGETGSLSLILSEALLSEIRKDSPNVSIFVEYRKIYDDKILYSSQMIAGEITSVSVSRGASSQSVNLSIRNKKPSNLSGAIIKLNDIETISETGGKISIRVPANVGVFVGDQVETGFTQFKVNAITYSISPALKTMTLSS